jgi:hypothetical protein
MTQRKGEGSNWTQSILMEKPGHFLIFLMQNGDFNILFKVMNQSNGRDVRNELGFHP